jgi:hypothetical protein
LNPAFAKLFHKKDLFLKEGFPKHFIFLKKKNYCEKKLELGKKIPKLAGFFLTFFLKTFPYWPTKSWQLIVLR